MTLHPADNRAQVRPVKVVLGDALDELRDREEKLARVSGELAEVRKAIAVLAKLVETKEHPQATRINPAGETKGKVLAVVKASLDPLSMEQIADLIGRQNGGWLAMLIKKLVDADELVEVEPGRYGLAIAKVAA